MSNTKISDLFEPLLARPTSSMIDEYRKDLRERRINYLRTLSLADAATAKRAFSGSVDEHYYECASEVVLEKATAAFIEQHELSQDEFETQHWQTLFAIQYPEARP